MVAWPLELGMARTNPARSSSRGDSGSKRTGTGASPVNTREAAVQQQPQQQQASALTMPNEAMTWAEWAWHRPLPEPSPSHAVRRRPWWNTHPTDQGEPAQPQGPDTTAADTSGEREATSQNPPLKTPSSQASPRGNSSKKTGSCSAATSSGNTTTKPGNTAIPTDTHRSHN